MAAIQNNEARAQFCSQRLLCRTLAGNNVYILTITSPASQEELKRKSVIVLTARVHPGETPSSWIMRGILHFLTGDSEVAADLRDRFIFKVLMNSPASLEFLLFDVFTTSYQGCAYAES